MSSGKHTVFVLNCVLLWLYTSTCVLFYWIPSHCGIEGNERVDQLEKDTFGHDIDPLATAHYTDLKPLVNSYILQLIQNKWYVAVHGRDLYLVKPTLGPPKQFLHLTRAEEVVIIRILIHLSVSWPQGELPPIRLQHLGCCRPRG